MKTAIIKTTVWKEDAFFELNMDSKLVFLYLLTTPEREIGRLFKFSKRIAVAYTGLSSEQIEICFRQLIASDLIKEYNGYVYLNDTSYSVPKSGRFTAVSLKKELANVPQDVLDHFGVEGADIELIEYIKKMRQEMKTADFAVKVKSLEQICKACGDSENLSVDHKKPLIEWGTNDINNLQMLCIGCNSSKGINNFLPELHRKNSEHKDIDIDNNKDIDINKDKEVVKLDENANRIASTMLTLVKENYSFVKIKDNELDKWSKDIEKIHRLDGHDWNLIEFVLRWSQNDDFWKQNIRSGAKLRKQFERLLISAKAEHDNKQKNGVDFT